MFELFLPDYQAPSIYDVDLETLKNQGVKGILTDLDNTLIGAKVPIVPPEVSEWLKQVNDAGFKVVIVSNNSLSRVSSIAEPLGLPFVHSARKPRMKAFQRALQLMELDASETLMIGDQLLTDVLGGNRIGLKTMLVKPIALQDEGVMTRVNRMLEVLVVARLKKRGYRHWGDHSQ